METVISIILPCYNEFKSLSKIHKKALYITRNYPIEIIFVNNGSTDQSKDFFNNLKTNEKIKVVNVPINKGYGYGIKMGLKSISNTKFFGWTHSDLQTDLFDLLKAYEIINSNDYKNNIFIKGERHARPILDKLISLSMGIFNSLLFLNKDFYEINAQPSIFPIDLKEKIICNAPNNYLLDLYAFIYAVTNNKNCIRVNVLFPKRTFGISHWNKGFKSKVYFISNNLAYSLKLFFQKIKKDF